MPVKLEVAFAGLNLFLIREDRSEVAVLQPNCRYANPYGSVHPDNMSGVAHVGYLRFDLANVDPRLSPAEPTKPPRYEGVHRFDGEEISFGLDEEAAFEGINTGLPRLENIAPQAGGKSSLVPITGLFTTKPDERLLMRAVLRGGTIQPLQAESWTFTSKLGTSGSSYADVFADQVLWTRTIEGKDEITLSFRRFCDEDPHTITLRPVTSDQPIRLKIANLCATDPLEWGEFDQAEPTFYDRDFKWLYRLFAPRQGTWADLLKEPELPFPSRGSSGPDPAGTEGCIGMEATVEKFADAE